jgi:hypothetical protein
LTSFDPAFFAASLRCITARHFIPMKKALPPKKAMRSKGVRRLRAHVHISIDLHL